jgi:hypothetical protein
MRRVSLAVVLALALPLAALAQGAVAPALANSTPEQRAKIQTALMKEKLSLTPEQLPKVAAINLQTAQKMDPVLKGNDRPLMKARAAKQIEQDKDAKLQGVLTPQQFQTWQASQEEMKQKLEQKLMEQRSGGGTP